MAVSVEAEKWVLVGASPDLRQQILQNPQLAPTGPRQSPIAGIVLVSADVDGLAGLLVLREQQKLRVWAPAPILRIIAENRLFAALDPALVEKIEIAPDVPMDTGLGLSLTLLEMPGKVPLYEEDRGAAIAQPAATYAARLDGAGRTAIIAPACARITDAVLDRLRDAHLLLFDGTLFTDDEMVRAGLSHKTGQRMGHVAVTGAEGSLTRLAGLSTRRVYFHINNTNPMLLDGSTERAQVEAAGFEVACDGMLIDV